jgi:folate-dependent phosphoribosylglycinamide formyltransferase PurN
MKFKICLLGTENNQNTRFMIMEMYKKGVEFSLVFERQKKKIPTEGNFIKNLSNQCAVFFKKFNNGSLKGLSPISYFYWKKIVDRILFSRSYAFKTLTSEYDDTSFHNALCKVETQYFDDINNSEARNYFLDSKFDIGVLGGIGFLSEQTINCFEKFCVNAHPAPLPQCRGGGALENTLSQGLNPSVSIHLVTPEIDGGDILKVVPVKLESNDSFSIVRLKLSIYCYQVLASVVFDVLSGEKLKRISNRGKLFYWKDCTVDVQKKAEKNLKILLAELSSK